MRKYRIMTWSDRLKMETLLNAGHTKADVARHLHFSKATITREYKRGVYMHLNSDLTYTERYSAEVAQRDHEYMQTGKGRPIKLGHDAAFAGYIEDLIVNEHYSPAAALASAEKLHFFDTHISVNTLYRYIDMGLFLNITNKNLPYKKKHKKRVYRKVQKRASAGESIEKRPQYIDSRTECGHWEMDTVKGKQGVSKSCLLVLTERKSRFELIFKMPDGTAKSVVDVLDMLEQRADERLGYCFSDIFKSITVDNGVEFSDCEGMQRSILNPENIRTKVYYCHAYSSWERGSNENCNRIIRRFAPKGTDLDKITHDRVKAIQDWINSYPRKILKYATAAEEFNKWLHDTVFAH